MPAKKELNLEELKKDYTEGKSLNSLASKYGCTRRTLSNQLKKAGVTVMSNNYRYQYNTELFKQINNEASAYWLGFLYADGYLQTRPRIELCLAELDLAHLVKFKNLVCNKLPIEKRKITLKAKKFTAYRVTVFSKEIYIDLLNLGLHTRKSLTLTFPTTDQVPKALIKHFIRGYIDGDGSISVRNNGRSVHLSIAGTFEMLSAMQEYFSNEIPGYIKTKLYKTSGNNTYIFQKGGSTNLLEVFEYLYKDATVFLERKFNIFKQYIENKNCRPAGKPAGAKLRKKSGTLKREPRESEVKEALSTSSRNA